MYALVGFVIIVCLFGCLALLAKVFVLGLKVILGIILGCLVLTGTIVISPFLLIAIPILAILGILMLCSAEV